MIGPMRKGLERINGVDRGFEGRFCHSKYKNKKGCAKNNKLGS
jgi:hypothetical protein